MAKKKGICRNEECELYDMTGKEFVQEADEFNFVCEKCGEPLFELQQKPSWWKMHGKQVMIALGAVVIIALIVWGVKMCSGGETERYTGPDTTDTVSSAGPDTTKVDSVDKKEPIKIVEEPETGKGPKTGPKEKVGEGNPDGKGVSTEPINGHGTLNLGYGRYEGDIKNGQPHGHGTITYTKSHQIVSSKDFMAKPGDKFEGEFRDGRISGGIGYWYHDGDITAVKP